MKSNENINSYKKSEFLLSKEEFICSVKVRSGSWLDGIGFTTNFGRTVYYGGNGISRF